MFTSHAADALAAANQRGRALRAEAASARLCPRAGRREALASSLRSAADRLDPVPLARRAAAS